MPPFLKKARAACHMKVGLGRGIFELHELRSAVDLLELGEAGEGSRRQNDRTTVRGSDESGGGGREALD